jgi:single-strand DNA-binding protein
VNLNKVMIAGNLTRDPELRHTAGNTSVCNFGVAVNRKWRDSNGETKEEVTFVDVAAWGKTGEAIAQYLAKGKPIYIEGRLKLDQWEKDGQRHQKLSVVAESFQFVGPKEGGTQQQARSSTSRAPAPATVRSAMDDEDDIPF